MQGAAGQPVHQLRLVVVEQALAGGFQQAAAGVAVQAQGGEQVIFVLQIYHQAAAAVGAGAGVVLVTRHHGESLPGHQAAASAHFEIQAAGQPKHQLRMAVAMGEMVVAVVAQGEDRVHANCFPKLAGRWTV